MWPCFLRSFLSLLPAFLAFLASFRVFHYLLIILRGWVLSWIHTNNTSVFSSLSRMRIFIFTPISLIVHLSLLLSSPPSSFLPPFFSFFPLFSSFFFPLSMQIFGAATAAMPHRFRRAWSLSCFVVSPNILKDTEQVWDWCMKKVHLKVYNINVISS